MNRTTLNFDLEPMLPTLGEAVAALDQEGAGGLTFLPPITHPFSLVMLTPPLGARGPDWGLRPSATLGPIRLSRKFLRNLGGRKKGET